MKRARILLVLDGVFYSRLPVEIIHALQNAPGLELEALLLDWDHPDYVRRHLSGCRVHYGYTSGIVARIAPDLVFCCQTWWVDMTKLLPEAVEQNIPVLMYDHGSLLTTCEYLLQRDETIAIYRSDLTHCSHAACWGKRPRDCWLTYGVPPEKLLITGAVQYDYLNQKVFQPQESRETLLQRLGIPLEAKVILFYIHYFHTHIDKPQRLRLMGVLKSLEAYVRRHPGWVLLLKPHPLTMAVSPTPFPHARETRLIANLVEKCWEGMDRADPDSLAAAASVIVTTISSMVISPLTLQKPIVHLELDTAAAREFSHYGRKVFYNLKKGMNVASLLDRIEGAGFLPPDLQENARLTSELNDGYGNNALSRLMAMIERILDDRKKGVSFYPLTPEQEFRQSARRSPGVPYAYRNLLKLHLKTGEIGKVRWVFRQYEKRFRDTAGLLGRIPLPEIRRFRDLALEMAKRLAAKKRHSAKEAYFIGKCFFKSGRYDESQAWLRRVLSRAEIPPATRLDVLFLLGKIAGQKDPRRRRAYHDRAIRSLPDLNRFMTDIDIYHIASTLERHHEFRKARQWFEKVVQVTPTLQVRAGSLFHLGAMAWGEKDFKEAEARFRRTLELNPEHKRTHEFLVNIYLQNGELDKARSLMRDHLDKFHDPKGLYEALPPPDSEAAGRLFLELAEIMTARKGLTAEELFFVAERLYENRRYASSARWFRKVIADQGSHLRFQLVAWFRLGDMAGRNHPERKEECYSRAIRALPALHAGMEDVNIYNIASTLKKFGCFREARQWFEKLVRLFPNEHLRSGAFFHLGEMALQQRDRSRAASLFQKALLINPEHRKAREYLDGIRRGAPVVTG